MKSKKMFNVIKGFYSAITTISSIIVLLISILAMKEYFEPVTNYFTHYGNLSINEVYINPETISVYSFGKTSPNKTLDVVNRLWCVSADSLSREWVLIGTQYNQIDNDIKLNSIPNEIQATALSKDYEISDLGVSARHVFQRLVDKDYELHSWSMGFMRPSIASSCYIETIVTSQSKLFKMPKSIKFRSAEFSYLFKDF